MSVRVGRLVAPASPGSEHVLTGFRGNSVFFLGSNQEDEGWEVRSSDASISMGIGNLDSTSTIKNMAWQHRYRAPDTSLKYLAGTGVYDDCCYQTMDVHGVRSSVANQVRIAVTGFDATGFTIDWVKTVADRVVYYIAFGSTLVDSAMIAYGPTGSHTELIPLASQGQAGLGFFGLGGNPLNTTTSGQVFGGFALSEYASGHRGGFSEFVNDGFLHTEDRYWQPFTNSSALAVPIYMPWIAGTMIGDWTSWNHSGSGSTWDVNTVDHVATAWATDSPDLLWRSHSATGAVGTDTDLVTGRDTQAVMVMGGADYGGSCLGPSECLIGGITLGIMGYGGANHSDPREYVISISKDRSTGGVVSARLENRSWISSSDIASAGSNVTSGTTSFPSVGTVRFHKLDDGTGSDSLGVWAFGPYLGATARVSFDRVEGR